MSTLRARDVLDQAHHFHAHLAGYFAGLGEVAASERVRLLYAWLSQHEEKLAHCLHRYLGDASPHVLDAWLQNVPDERLLMNCAVGELLPDAEAEKVIEAAQQYEDCLMQLYRAMSQATPREDVREMFESLILMEEEERHRASRNLQTLFDW